MDALALPADLIPAERHQHDQIEPVETVKAGQKAGRVVDYMTHLLRSRRISQAQHDVVNEYAELRWEAGMIPHATAGTLHDAKVDGGGNGLIPGEKRSAALQRLLTTDAKLKPIHVQILAAIADGWGAAAWARAQGYPREGRVGVDFLRSAADELGRAWGRW